MEQKKLVVSIIQFLKASLPSLNSDSAESLMVSIDCIKDAFEVNEQDQSLQTPLSLQDIFNKYSSSSSSATSPTTTTTSTTTTSKPLTIEQVLEQMLSEIPTELHQSFNTYFGILKEKGAFNDQTQYETVMKLSKQKFMESKSVEIKEIAEKLKVEGNNKLSALDYKGAIECYNKAILYEPNNAIYYANRSSAYNNLKQFDKAADDANEAIKKNPNYGKAYFRLGSAYVSLGKIQEAIEAYKKAIELEPNSEVYKSSLANAEAKLSSPTAAGNGGMPNLDGLDFNSLLSNPNIMNMAQNLMKDPNMKGYMENQNFQEMAKNVMSNPNLMSMLGNMMGGKK